jgi:hypothetical protein
LFLRRLLALVFGDRFIVSLVLLLLGSCWTSGVRWFGGAALRRGPWPTRWRTCGRPLALPARRSCRYRSGRAVCLGALAGEEQKNDDPGQGGQARRAGGQEQPAPSPPAAPGPWHCPRPSDPHRAPRRMLPGLLANHAGRRQGRHSTLRPVGGRRPPRRGRQLARVRARDRRLPCGWRPRRQRRRAPRHAALMAGEGCQRPCRLERRLVARRRVLRQHLVHHG